MVVPSWAIPQGPPLLVGVLHTGIVTTDWARAFRAVQLPAGTIFSYSSHWPYDVSRNQIVRLALQHNVEWLFFLDSDVLPPADVVTRLMGHNLPIVQGLYYSKVEGNAPLVMRRVSGPDGKEVYTYLANWTPGELVPVDTIATGCLLIHRRVLQAFDKAGIQWFEWTMGRPGFDEGLSEDFEFGKRAKNMGFPMYVDTGVVASHAMQALITGPGKWERPMTP